MKPRCLDRIVGALALAPMTETELAHALCEKRTTVRMAIRKGSWDNLLKPVGRKRQKRVGLSAIVWARAA